jgi:proline iminopeptidase
MVVLHGGPSFDLNYLLPEMDRLADSFRLVYYSQRGRGLSSDGVDPEDVTMDREVEDLEMLRKRLGLDTVALIGHSWGGFLAMCYAVAHSDRVSHLILLNTAPASHADWQLLQAHFEQNRPPADNEIMQRLRGDEAYQRGELKVEEEYYRAHFRMTVPRSELLEEMVGRLRVNFTPERTVEARRIGDRLQEETWRKPEFDLLPALSRLDVPTLVISSEFDFIPVEPPSNIAASMPGGRLVVLDGCGHFSFMESPDRVSGLVTGFVGGTTD